jgi:glycosyltransferase involved in cell wall biosynthesis
VKYKSALIHDWLVNIAGSEKVLEEIYRLYPSPIYTLLINLEGISDSVLSDAEISTSFIQKLPFAKRGYRSYLPFFPMAIEQFDLSEYDVILSSSHAVAKGILKRSDQLHICYCHTPMRYIWDIYHQYMQDANLTRGFKAFIARFVIHYLRLWDVTSSNRVDYFIANSRYVANRIEKIYRRDARVIYPPVDTESFEFNDNKDDYYLAASRMVPYKRMDIVVEAFTRMKDKRLVVVGDGPEMKKIKKIAGKNRNIEIVGYQPFDGLKEYMKKTRAFIFPALEDFGIMPVEAQACGTPVIAYGRGGAAETVVDKRTGILFYEQRADSIYEAVHAFEKSKKPFDPKLIHQNSMKFSRDKFRKKYKDCVERCVEEFYRKSGIG